MNYLSSSVSVTRSGLLAKHVLLLIACVGFVLTSPLRAYTYTTANLTTSSDTPSQIETIPLSVTATQVTPPKITITTYAPGTFTINRKDPSSSTWTQQATGVNLAANGTWSDSSVVVGQMYEYQFVNTASTPYSFTYGYSIYASGLYPHRHPGRPDPAQGVDGRCHGERPAGQHAGPSTPNISRISSTTAGRCVRFRFRDARIIIRDWAMARLPRSRSTVGAHTSIGNNTPLYLTDASNGKEAIGTVTVSSGTITAVSSVVTIGGVTVWGNIGSGFKRGRYAEHLRRQAHGRKPGLRHGQRLLDPIDPQLCPPDQRRAPVMRPGQSVTLTGQTSGASVQATLNSTNGVVQGFSLPGSAPGFISNEPLTLSGNTSGSGIGPLAAYVYNGNMTYVYIYSPGTGYTSGEAGTVTGNQSGATAPSDPERQWWVHQQRVGDVEPKWFYFR